MNEELKRLISSEIAASVKWLRENAVANRLEASKMLEAALDKERKANRFEFCDQNGSHEFETCEGSGMMGDRFEEKCKHCGWSNFT